MDAEKYALGLRSVIMESQWMQSATHDGVIPFWKSAYNLQNTDANCTAQAICDRHANDSRYGNPQVAVYR